jgi:hypothetical protein
MENLDELILNVYPGSLQEFRDEVIDCMYDRKWCKDHDLKYHKIKYGDAKEALYKDYLKKELKLD